MLSLVCAAVLSQATLAERLHLDVFEDYAKEVIGESYSLDITTDVAERPVVWYLGKRANPVADLKRSCSLLGLGITVDENAKSITIAGPGADPHLKEKVMQNLALFRQASVELSRIDPDDLKERLKTVENDLGLGRVKPGEEVPLKIGVQAGRLLWRNEGAIILALLADYSDSELAELLVEDHSRLKTIPLKAQGNAALKHLIEAGRTGPFNDNDILKAESVELQEDMRNSNAKREADFRQGLAGDHKLEIWGRERENGGVLLMLVFIREDGHTVLASANFQGQALGGTSPNTVDREWFMRSYDRFARGQSNPLITGMFVPNQVFEELVGTDQNTVSWLCPSEMLNEAYLESFHYFSKFQVVKLSDGWVQGYVADHKYPDYGQGIGDVIALFKRVSSSGGLEWGYVSDFLKKRSVKELNDCSEAAWGLGLTENWSWLGQMYLAKAAVIELEARGGVGFSGSVKDMSPACQAVINDALDGQQVYFIHPSLALPIHRRMRGIYLHIANRGNQKLEASLTTTMVGVDELSLRSEIPLKSNDGR